jgi:hypothetical protein
VEAGVKTKPTVWFLVLGISTYSGDQRAFASTAEGELLLQKLVAANRWDEVRHIRSKFDARILPAASPKAEPLRRIGGSVETIVASDRLSWVKQNDPIDGAAASRIATLSLPERRICWNEGRFVQYTESKKIIDRSASIDRGLTEGGWFLDGSVPLDFDADRPILTPAIAAQSGRVDPQVIGEQVGGVDCRKLTVSGDGWVWSIWVAPDRGFNFAKYELAIKADPIRKRLASDWTVDGIEFQQAKDGRWFVSGGTLAVAGLTSKAGKPTILVTRVTRELVEPLAEVTKSEAFAPPAIPDETVVYWDRTDDKGEDLPPSGIDYVWRKGKVEPLHDPKVVDDIKQQIEQVKKQAKPTGE